MSIHLGMLASAGLVCIVRQHIRHHIGVPMTTRCATTRPTSKEEKVPLLLEIQSNPLKWIALGPDYEYPLRQSIRLFMFCTLHCV